MKIIEIQGENYKDVIDSLLKRGEDDFTEVDQVVYEIISDIKRNGDRALIEYTAKFDKARLEGIKVSENEIAEAIKVVGDEFLKILEEAKENITDYHKKQLQNSWMSNEQEGIILGQVVSPLERVGIYVPGGKAAYPSTVLMNALPAKVAGVSSIAMVTPPNKEGKVNPYILAAAYIADVDEIYKVGGAQSIAALAYGTETIKPVNKIVGPGNIYVARAKRAVFGLVDIDMIAGPSEICIIADENKNPSFIAADLLSQAEHDEMASSILITTSKDLAMKVKEEVKIQTEKAERRKIIMRAISNYGYIFIARNIDEAIDIANEIAPEHLEVMVDNPFELLPKIKNAGAIFLGEYTPEPVGDYFAGPNHTLPTSGTAKFSSPLGTYDFMKKSSFLYYSKEALRNIKDKVISFTEAEGLSAHGNSIKVRF
ncbi:histidinol dehydrogenase [Paramaledivibacter caminithermalis]|uniref:Histidinol dehydrogenase n=1 Tax=Paramaledivibacter caminithermalis (strain DSM 15212 / CIP 107654 / DViRD3) TaxID=1121301 RepID=A0A1M6K9A3_PARC5|nr:histidinol dehydrogenase [Paramaledivibacter caminithermalis]SHJ55541.1 histidinol dehydrogenase [Paramaledivibacter caminithermalis DSM 15212]